MSPDGVLYSQCCILYIVYKSLLKWFNLFRYEILKSGSSEGYAESVISWVQLCWHVVQVMWGTGRTQRTWTCGPSLQALTGTTTRSSCRRWSSTNAATSTTPSTAEYSARSVPNYQYPLFLVRKFCLIV